MSVNIYAGGLSYKLTEDDLRREFEGFGEVTSVKIITDRDTGDSKGFGFVEMSNDSEAEKAIDELNGKEVDGRKIVVNKARPREERPRSRSGKGW